MYLKKTQITNNFPEYGHECYCEDGADAQNWIVKYDVFSFKKKGNEMCPVIDVACTVALGIWFCLSD